jgi:hypothetical protein
LRATPSHHHTSCSLPLLLRAFLVSSFHLGTIFKRLVLSFFIHFPAGAETPRNISPGTPFHDFLQDDFISALDIISHSSILLDLFLSAPYTQAWSHWFSSQALALTLWMRPPDPLGSFAPSELPQSHVPTAHSLSGPFFAYLPKTSAALFAGSRTFPSSQQPQHFEAHSPSCIAIS